MNFLVDAQLPPGLARWLADQGHSAKHVNDVGLAGAEDSVIWNHALGVDAIIVKRRGLCRTDRTNSRTGRRYYQSLKRNPVLVAV